jgi:hypothetical protein
VRCPDYPVCLPPAWAGLSTDLNRFLERQAARQASATDASDWEDEWTSM